MSPAAVICTSCPRSLSSGMVRVPAYEQLAEVISGSINKVDGVLETDTHLAFRTYSQRDLDAGFDLGLDD